MQRDLQPSQPLEKPWRITEIGKGQVIPKSDAFELRLPQTDGVSYHDAQITDYAGKTDFFWRPPVRLSIRAWVERPAPLVGTAGFGFWNHPFVPGERGLRLPQAVWFFFSAPPSNMALADGVSGPGWKAATIDATRWQFLMLAPTAPIGVLLMRIPALYRRLWPVGQRAIGVSEKLLDSNLLLTPHTYEIDWQPNEITFSVDGVVVHQTPSTPRGPLGFIAWIDNQYAIVTPQGQLGFGVVEVGQAQSLMVQEVKVER